MAAQYLEIDSNVSLQNQATAMLSSLGEEGVLLLKEKIGASDPTQQYFVLMEVLKMREKGLSLTPLGTEGVYFLKQALERPENTYNREQIQKALDQIEKEHTR